MVRTSLKYPGANIMCTYYICKGITRRRVWKIGEPRPSISPSTGVMNRSRPSGNNKCEPHVEIIDYKNIMTCKTFPIRRILTMLRRCNRISSLLFLLHPPNLLHLHLPLLLLLLFLYDIHHMV